MKITDEIFLTKIKQKDEAALEYIISEYGGVIKSVISKHLYQLEAYKEECINDVLLGVWQNIDRFDPNKNSLKHWIAGVARHKALTYVRKYVREVSHQSIEDVELVQEDTNMKSLLEADEKAYLEKMLSVLKEEDQKIFCKIYLEDQEIEAISSELGLKREVIYNRVSKGKKKLKSLFGHHYNK